MRLSLEPMLPFIVHHEPLLLHRAFPGCFANHLNSTRCYSQITTAV